MNTNSVAHILCACLIRALFLSPAYAAATKGTANVNNTALNNCRKQHNVYECEMTAVPKKMDNK